MDCTGANVAFEILIEPADNLAIITLRGTLGLAELVEAYEGMLAHPEFQPGMHALWDAREGVPRYGPDGMPALINHLRSRQSKRGSGYRVAFVADPVGQRTEALMLKALATVLPFSIEIYQDLERARHWVLTGKRKGH